MATVIYGPMATGKTMLAAVFAAHFGCNRVVEGDEAANGFTPRANDLVLTNAPIGAVRRRYRKARIVHINEARLAIGREPAPPSGFTTRPVFIPAEPPAQPDCACRCHTGTCGENDMVMAERTILLVERLRPMSRDLVDAIDDLVQRAGVDFARASTGTYPTDDDVPF
jgi:hypothetical protein